jgi:hypothetical protein
MTDDIAIKIEHLELFKNIKTYLFINISNNISKYSIELYSDNNKLIINNVINKNSVEINNILTFDINPKYQYFLKIEYVNINGISNIWHKFINIDTTENEELDNEIQMIIHLNKSNKLNKLNKFNKNFWEDCDEDNESNGFDEEPPDSEDENNENNV